MWARTTCLLLLVAGCGDNLPADGFRGGSRLRAVFLSDGDGARQFETFHDPWLGVDCRYQGDPPRCLPEVATLRAYLDPGCSEPVFGRGVTDSACNPPPEHFGLSVEEDACSTEPTAFRRIWKRGERITPALIYVVDDGQCVPRAARSDYEYYSADFELPVDGFVTAQRLLAAAGVHRLRDVVLIGDDGSQQPVRFYDDELGAECSLDGRFGACVPDLVPTLFSSDWFCTQPLGAWTTSACGPAPAFVGGVSADGALEVFERRDQVGAEQVYLLNLSGSCVGVPPAAGVDYFRPGASVVDDLATIDDVLTGTGRLGAYRHGGFRDRDRGSDCNAVPTGPGVWHCLPELGVTVVRLFADPLCEQAVDVFEREGPGKPTRGLIWRPSIENECESHARLYDVGSEIASGSLYEARFIGCQRLTWNPDEITRYAVGRELPFDDYVRLTRVTE